MKIIAIIQARMSSSRLPGKVLMKLGKKTVLEVIIDRLKFSNRLDEIVVATSTSISDDKIVEFCKERNINCFRGSEQNVLNRFFNAAKLNKADIVVRITSDDPFKDPEIIDKCIEILISKNLDFCANNNPPTFPEGLDVEVFKMDALIKAENNSTSEFEREHVTQHFYKNNELFSQYNLKSPENYSHYRLTLDTQEDFDLISKLYNNLDCERRLVKLDEIIEYLNHHPEIVDINRNVKRSQMYLK